MGIDPSLTATGIIVLNGREVKETRTTPNRPDLGTIERVFIIHNIITNLIKEQPEPLDLIVIEGFSYGSKGRSVFDIAYLGWRIREELDRLEWDNRIPWLEVPPSQLKKFATGKGNSGKDIILQQVYKRWGYETHDNNIADAYVLAQIGRAYLGNSDDLTAFQKEVIKTLRKGDVK